MTLNDSGDLLAGLADRPQPRRLDLGFQRRGADDQHGRAAVEPVGEQSRRRLGARGDLGRLGGDSESTQVLDDVLGPLGRVVGDIPDRDREVMDGLRRAGNHPRALVDRAIQVEQHRVVDIPQGFTRCFSGRTRARVLTSSGHFAVAILVSYRPAPRPGRRRRSPLPRPPRPHAGTT